MFKGEKTSLFWVGLLILSLASISVFAMIWSMLMFYSSYPRGNLLNSFGYNVPVIVGGLVFMLVGFYMMRSGVKKTSIPPTL